eukprot:EG_transcript_5543
MIDQQCHFDETFPVHLRRDDRPPATVPLRLSLLSEKQDGKRRVVVRLTDPADYLFLLITVIGEEDYGRFKEANRLHVDFASFPPKLASELRSCIREARPEGLAQYVQLVLQQTSGRLTIVQSDAFGEREMVGIPLQRPGDEEQKRFLADRAKHFEALLAQARQRESALQAELDQCRSAHAALQQSHAAQSSDWRCRAAETDAAKRAELAELTQRLQNEAAQDRLDVERRFELQVRSLSDTNTDLSARLAELSEGKVRLEAQLRETSRSLQVAEEQVKFLTTEKEKYRAENQSLQAKNYHDSAQLETARAQIARLEEKVSGLTAHNETLNVTLQGKAQLDAAFEAAKERELDLRRRLAEEERRTQEVDQLRWAMTEKMEKYGEKWKQERLRTAALEQRCKDLELQARRTEIDVQGLEEKLAAKDHTISDKDEHIRKLQAEVAALQGKVSTAEQANQYLSNKLNTMTAPPSASSLSHLSAHLSTLATPLAGLGHSPLSSLLPQTNLSRAPGLHDSSAAAYLPPSHTAARPSFTANPPALMRILAGEASPLTGKPLQTTPPLPAAPAAPSLAAYLGSVRPASPPEGPSNFFS